VLKLVQAVRGCDSKEACGTSQSVCCPPPVAKEHTGAAGQGKAFRVTNSNSASQAVRTAFKFPSSTQRKAAPTGPQSAGYIHSDGSVTPVHSIVHSGSLDLADAWSDAAVHAPPTVPQKLVVRVSLPGVPSAAVVDLDVKSKQLSLCVAAKFKLDLSLPFSVRSDNASAKFDKVKGELVVTMPVVPPRPPAPAIRAQSPAISSGVHAGHAVHKETEADSSAAAFNAATPHAEHHAGSTRQSPCCDAGSETCEDKRADDAIAVCGDSEPVPRQSSGAGTSKSTSGHIHESAATPSGGLDLTAAAQRWADVHQAQDAQTSMHAAQCTGAGSGGGAVSMDEQRASQATLMQKDSQGDAGVGGSEHINLPIAVDFDFVNELD
jgi:PIH1 CS-like domain